MKSKLWLVGVVLSLVACGQVHNPVGINPTPVEATDPSAPTDHSLPATLPMDFPPYHTQLERVLGCGDHWCDPSFRWRGVTAFMLFKRWVEGDQAGVQAFLDAFPQANVVRVFLMAWNIEHFDPRVYPTYWEELPKFLDYLDVHNRRAEIVVFADAQLINLNQQEFYRHVISILLKHQSHFLELGNEFPYNGFNPSEFAQPTGLTASSGSRGSGDEPLPPQWDYITYHVSRGPNWWTERPPVQPGRLLITDEITGAANFDRMGSRDSRPEHFLFYLSLFPDHSGVTFHCESCVRAVVPTGIEAAIARQWFE